MDVVVGSRKSPLAQVQVQEVLEELQRHHPDIRFCPICVESTGDKDQKTSLRTLDKTDFFTKEIDQMLLKGECRIGIHSAKDLPEPLPEGLAMVALTKGVDSSDSLVLRSGVTIDTLPPNAIIATSSLRREEAVQQMRPGHPFNFVDLRGTIGQRLSVLDKGEADGVVLAEAALIRLGLTHLNRERIPGDTTPLQGQLAVIAREGDLEMEKLFQSIDSRGLSLFVGLEVPAKYKLRRIVHCPLIEIVPRPTVQLHRICDDLHTYSHIIFTSKAAVDLFFDGVLRYVSSLSEICRKQFIAVGQATARRLRERGALQVDVARQETAEGVVDLLKAVRMKNDEVRMLWPHADGARTVITDWLDSREVSYEEVILYDTKTKRVSDLPPLSLFEEVIFSSPSTVKAFRDNYGELPHGLKLTAIGPVTQEALSNSQMIGSCLSA